MSSPFDAEEIVAAAYRTLLLREPDPEGLAFGAANLAQHHSVEQALAGLLGSHEFRTQLPLFLARYQPTAVAEGGVNIRSADAGFGTTLHEPDAIDRFIRSHAAWRDEDVLRRLGDPIDGLRQPRLYRCSLEADRAELQNRGVRVHGAVDGAETAVIFDESAAPISVEVQTQGWSDNVVIFGPNCQVQGHFTFGGSGNLIYCGGRLNQPQIYRAALYTNSSAFVFGAGSTSVGANFHIEGPRHHVVVGRDCMFSAEVYVAGTDNHAIFDMQTGAVLNLPQDVLIGPNAWLGFGATLLKGAHVGEGAVVAARAVLTKPAAAHTLMAGSPAQAIRTGVAWDRAFPSSLHRPPPAPHP